MATLQTMLKRHLVNAALALGILLLLMLIFGLILPHLWKVSAPPRIANTPSIIQQVQTLSQLVTVKYVMEKVVILSDPKYFADNPFTESRLLMVAHGIVKAGVDLGELKSEDIQVSDNKITIKLPPARITDSYLDDKHTEVIERTTGYLRRFDKELEQNARRQAVSDINRAAREGGILKDADERARAQLTNLFRVLGYQEVKFLSP
jgi:Protein of unknown function (DUF4230)